jgi:hypothetical protein
MHTDLLDPTKDIKFASKFWFDSTLPAHAKHHSLPPRNLYELFVLDVAMLIAAASQAHHAARLLYRSLPADQTDLREFVFSLTYPVCSCLPDLPFTLMDEGLVLSPTHDEFVNALLSTIHPETWTNGDEPWSVVGTRIGGVLHKVALHLEAQAIDAAESAHILGSEPLHEAFRQWATCWREYVVDLCARKPVFRALAYAAGPKMPIPLWQVA